jgi:lysozyme
MSIIPKGRPKLSPIDVRKIAQAKGFEVPKTVKVAILVIRGYYLDCIGKPGKEDRNTYDDAGWIIQADRCTPFNYNTDPSSYRKGMATLVPQVAWIIPGMHKIGSPKGYSAFRQFGNVTVMRDDQGLHTGYFGINNHRGGVLGTSSEGCQTVPPLQWTEYKTAIHKVLGITDADVFRHPAGVPGKQFPYILVTKDEAEKILGKRL